MTEPSDTSEDFATPQTLTEPQPPPEGIGTAEGPPDPPPAHVPAEGWLSEPQFVACWINCVAGKIVEARPAWEYEAFVFDSGVTDGPVTSMINTGVAVANPGSGTTRESA